MNKPMKLKGRIFLEDDRTLTFHSTLHDGGEFSMPVDQFDVELNDPFMPSTRMVDGWLFVQQEAQQGSVVYLTLPKPTIAHGKQIVVRDLQLTGRYATIDDFKKPSLKGQKVLAPAAAVIAEKPESEDAPVDLGDLQEEFGDTESVVD